MTRAANGSGFGGRLLVWSGWGLLCAAPSFVWALQIGFGRIEALAGMAAGIAFYVLIFAWFTSRPAVRTRVDASGLSRALHWAAGLRAAGSMLTLGYADLALGAVALQAVARSGRFVPPGVSEGGDALLAAFLITLVQGGLIVATLLLLAAAVWGGRALWRGRETGLALR